VLAFDRDISERSALRCGSRAHASIETTPTEPHALRRARSVFERVVSSLARSLRPCVCLSEIRATNCSAYVYVDGQVSVNVGSCPLDITPVQR